MNSADRSRHFSTNVVTLSLKRTDDLRSDPSREARELFNLGLVPSGSVIQGCLLRVQKCAVGRSQSVSSSVPARTRRKPSSELDAPQTQEPHSGQTHPVTTPPLRGSVIP